jgi:hypothetical protein
VNKHNEALLSDETADVLPVHLHRHPYCNLHPCCIYIYIYVVGSNGVSSIQYGVWDGCSNVAANDKQRDPSCTSFGDIDTMAATARPFVTAVSTSWPLPPIRLRACAAATNHRRAQRPQGWADPDGHWTLQAARVHSEEANKLLNRQELGLCIPRKAGHALVNR